MILLRNLQKELQSKLLRLHQKVSHELSNVSQVEEQVTSVGQHSWQRRTWKDNCTEIAKKSKAWSIEVHEIQGNISREKMN